MDKVDAVHTCRGILAIKERNNAICSNLDEPTGCHTEWRQSDTERQMSHDITFMWNLKKWHKWNRLTDVWNKHVYQREGMGDRGEIN